MNIPNSLTLLRIFFVPLLVVVLLTREPNVVLWGVHVHFEVWGVLILAIAATTDWLDGYLARRRGEVTTLGILLDPIADKLLISAAFISMVDMSLVPAWMVVGERATVDCDKLNVPGITVRAVGVEVTGSLLMVAVMVLVPAVMAVKVAV